MPSKQHAVMVLKQKPESPHENIEVQEIHVPSPKDGEVLLKVLCRPINPAGTCCGRTARPALPYICLISNSATACLTLRYADIFSLQGVYPSFKPPLPATPGLEGRYCSTYLPVTAPPGHVHRSALLMRWQQVLLRRRGKS